MVGFFVWWLGRSRGTISLPNLAMFSDVRAPSIVVELGESVLIMNSDIAGLTKSWRGSAYYHSIIKMTLNLWTSAVHDILTKNRTLVTLLLLTEFSTSSDYRSKVLKPFYLISDFHTNFGFPIRIQYTRVFTPLP